MANNCFYDMKVKGAENNVKEFIRAMRWEDEYEKGGVGRVFTCYITSEYEEDNAYVVELAGDCAWSVLTSMLYRGDNDLINISKRLTLAIEVYSEECGMEFQEHICVINGELICNECVDYIDIPVDYITEDADSLEAFFEHKLCKAYGVTAENYMQFVSDDCIKLGGFDDHSWEI